MMKNNLLRGARILNEFEVVKLLGQGNYTSVYLIRSLVDKSLIALKMYQGPYQNNRVFQQRFKREFELTVNLIHPNLVSYKRAGILDDSPYIFMEYVHGKTAKDLISHHGRIPVKIALPIFADALNGLGYLHENAIVHRDFKPSAIFINFEGKVKLADFDIAKKFSQEENLTEKGAVLGSPLYMSPEQRLGGNIDQRSDIFSAGTTLYEMITGKNPWASLENLPTDRQSWSKIELPSQLFSDSSEDLDKFILQAMDPRPNNRFLSAKIMLDYLYKTDDWKQGVASLNDVIKFAQGERLSESDILLEKKQERRSLLDKITEIDKNNSQLTKDINSLNMDLVSKQKVLNLVEKEKKRQRIIIAIIGLVGIVLAVIIAFLTEVVDLKIDPTPTPTLTPVTIEFLLSIFT